MSYLAKASTSEILLAATARAAGDDDDDDDDDVAPVDQDKHRLEALLIAALLQINFSHWVALIPSVTQALSDLGAERLDETMEGLDAPAKAEAAQAWADAWAKNRAAQLVGRKWIGDQTVDDPDAEMAITTSTPDMVKPVVETAFKEDMTLDELIEALNKIACVL